MTPSPVLLQKLSRSRLMVRGAKPSLGVGERRSKTKGAGLEFADHREYQPGDDVRHLDLHLHARLGEHYIRQYAVYQQLPVTIIVDGSASMNYGEPGKFDFARGLAGALGFVALAGGDLIQAAVWSGDRLHWSPRLHGARRAQVLFAWLAAQRPAGRTSFARALRLAPRRLSPGGLLILISDWWMDEFEDGLKPVGAAGQELIAIHVAAPEELAPAAMGGGEVRLVDAESGHEVELVLDRATIDRYDRAFADWRERLRQHITRQHGRYLQVRSDDDPERLLLQDWRRAGLIG